jgi:hypothetical protein
MVWLLPIVPEVTTCIVTVTIVVGEDEQALAPIVEIVVLLYCVVTVNDPGLYVDAVSSESVNQFGVVRFVLYSHLYEIVPSPVPSVELVKPAGMLPLQSVWSLPIAPAVITLCTVTVTGVVEDDSQGTPFNVDIVVLLYCVVTVNVPGLYVIPIWPPIGVQLGVDRLVLDSHLYEIIPLPVPGVVLVIPAGGLPLQIV